MQRAQQNLPKSRSLYSARFRRGKVSGMTMAEVVLDTNVALDWLVFGNPGVARLVRAIEAGQLRRVACPRMRDELAHVLGRGLAQARGLAAADILGVWDQGVTLVPNPVPGAAERLHCSDPDDQVFIDLALARRAWLFSRDRALLKLARRARLHGADVTPPERWPPAGG